MPTIHHPFHKRLPEPMGEHRTIQVLDYWFRTEMEAREQYAYLTKYEGKEATKPKMKEDGTWAFMVLP